MEVLTLTIACHEGRPPADAIFAYPGWPQPVLDEVAQGFRDLKAGKNIRGVIAFD